MKSLPKKPNLEYLKKEAQVFRKLHVARNLQFCVQIRQFDKSCTGKSDQDIFESKFTVVDGLFFPRKNEGDLPSRIMMSKSKN